MDCIDCHNTVGHPISPTPEQAVDRAIAAALVSRDLPFARREGVRLLKESYPDQDAGVRAIEQGLRKFYESQAGNRSAGSGATVAAVQDLYRQNVFPAMKVTWGAYRTTKATSRRTAASAVTTIRAQGERRIGDQRRLRVLPHANRTAAGAAMTG